VDGKVICSADYMRNVRYQVMLHGISENICDA
jgi:hypothetical protein